MPSGEADVNGVKVMPIHSRADLIFISTFVNNSVLSDDVVVADFGPASLKMPPLDNFGIIMTRVIRIRAMKDDE